MAENRTADEEAAARSRAEADSRSRWDLLRIASSLLALLALVIALGAVWIVAQRVTNLQTASEAMLRLKIVVGYEILILIFFFGLIVLLNMAAGRIDLSMLLCEPKGTSDCAASMSRFQLLIFTFVISLSLFLVIVGNDAKSFPTVPSEILLLLGISASTYAVGKGIQASGGGNGGSGDAATAAAHSAAGAANTAAAAANTATSGAHVAAAAAHTATTGAHTAAAAANTAAAAAQGVVPPPPPPKNP